MKPFKLAAAICTLIIMGGLASGCRYTYQPNQPFSGPLPLIDDIQRRNPVLARELRKLPEILDGIDDNDKKALGHITAYYSRHPAKFDKAFEQMFQTGLPESRQFSTPLQALFWVAMRYPLSQKDVISNYSLKTLLSEAWTYDPILDPQTMQQLIASIKDKDLRQFYEKKFKKKDTIIYLMEQDAEANPEMFTRAAVEQIKKLRRISYWNDYNTVMARLNSPELLDFYTKQKITYRHWYQINTYDSSTGDPRYVFRTRSGDCLYISEFISTALQRNGYKAWVQKVAPTDNIGGFWHAHCVFENKGKHYIIDNGSGLPRGIFEYR